MKSTITVKGDPDTLTKLFAAEDHELSNNRARYTIASQEESIRFDIEADDAVALRAVLNAITKTLEVFEKMGNIK